MGILWKVHGIQLNVLSHNCAAVIRWHADGQEAVVPLTTGPGGSSSSARVASQHGDGNEAATCTDRMGADNGPFDLLFLALIGQASLCQLHDPVSLRRLPLPLQLLLPSR